MKLWAALLVWLSKPVQSDHLRQTQVTTRGAAETRIVGGSQASAGSYPFFVKWNGCGASLIHEDILLTAAHCSGISNNDVLVGAHTAVSQIFGDAESRRIVARRSHPEYNDARTENDFMVMKINRPSTKEPVSLSTDADAPYANDVLTVIGFGTTSEGGPASSTLQEVDVGLFSHSTCNWRYGGNIVESVMFCAGASGGGKDSCQGDSGGPIIDANGVQQGVVSWGNGCARPFYPGVYARIGGAIDWISDQICDLSDNPPDSCSSGPGNQSSPLGRGYGESCSQDSQCIAPQICSLGECSSGAVGERCWYEDDCLSDNTCEGIFSPTCKAKKDKGSYCDEHTDCVSGRCGWTWSGPKCK